MEGSKPTKGRKSLLAECARNSGVSFTACDMESFLVDFPRLSSNTGANVQSTWQERRASGQGQGGKLVLETPVNRGLTSSAKTTTSNIPRRLLASASTTAISSTNKLPPKGAPSSTGGSRGRLAAKAKVPNSGTGTKSKVTTGMSGLQRSISMESFSQNTNMVFSLITPRGRSQSPGPDVAKTIKLPGSKEKQLLNGIAFYIVECLKALQFPKEFTLKSFQHLSTKDFHSICGFLLELFVGPKGEKTDDLTYIIDSLKILAFPGPTSKSHLKTPNTPHALPTVYTILSWLCNLAEVFMNPEMNPSSFQARLNEEFLWESYLRLFYQYFSEKDYQVEVELENYRINLAEFHHPNPIPKEKLVEEIQAKQSEKENLFALKDPRQDLLQVIATQQELLAKSRKRISDLGDMKQKYSNINALETEWRTLSSDLKRNQSFLQNLVEQIANQVITPESAVKIRADTEKARKEKEMLQKLIDDLQRKVKRQEQFLSNDEARFYDLCGQFSVLELYNTSAKNWDSIFPPISANPLDLAELDVWLNDTIKKIEAAQKRMEEFEVACGEKCRRLKQENEELGIKVDAYKEDYDRLSEELQTKLNQESGKLELIDIKIREAENKRTELEAKIAAAEKNYETYRKNAEDAEAEIAKYYPFLKELQQYSSELDAHIEEKYSVLKLAEIDLESTLMSIVIDARNRINAPLSELDDPKYGK